MIITKYHKKLEEILYLKTDLCREVDKFLEMNARDNTNPKQHALVQFNGKRFKKTCGRLKKKLTKMIEHLHELDEVTKSDDFSLIYYLLSQQKGRSNGLIVKLQRLFINHRFNKVFHRDKASEFYNIYGEFFTSLYSGLYDRYHSTTPTHLRNEFKKDGEHIYEELKEVIYEANDLASEHRRLGSLTKKRFQELIIKLSKRETETLNLEQFSEFKGKINTHFLFSIVDEKYMRIRSEGVNSSGKLDAKFGAQKSKLLRISRMTSEIDSDLPRITPYQGYSINDVLFKVECLIPPKNLMRKFKINSFEKYHQLIKNTVLETIKKVFSNNTKFFYDIYGKQFNINLKIVLFEKENPRESAYVQPERKLVSSKSAGSWNVPKLVLVTEPHNIQISISNDYVARLAIKKDHKHLESTIIHELSHWFTKHIHERSGISNLFSEGFAVFSQYCTHPKYALNNWLPSTIKVVKLIKRPLSIEHMEFVLKDDRLYAFILGFYMWLIIYVYKIKGKEGKKCFIRGINKGILIEIADENAFRWLRTFRRMEPQTFFKQYAETTKKMNVPSIFNKAAMKFMIETANEEVAKRKRAIETRKANRNLLKLARHLEQRDLEKAKLKRSPDDAKIKKTS